MPQQGAILALHSRKSRRHARPVAMAEALRLLCGLDARALSAGPLVEERVRCWIALHPDRLGEAAARLRLVGYSERIDALVPVAPSEQPGSDEAVIRWQRRTYRRSTLVHEEPEDIRSAAPDRRDFLFEAGDGSIKLVRGYRGSSGALEKRGLSAVDARALVNLVFRPGLGALLDPFAGAGGIVLAAARAGWRVTASDIDARLRLGLAQMSDANIVADARRLPFAAGAFDAIATEPPYHETQAQMLSGALFEMARVLRPGARLSMLAPQWQVELSARQADTLPLRLAMREKIDRRGDVMEILVLERL